MRSGVQTTKAKLYERFPTKSGLAPAGAAAPRATVTYELVAVQARLRSKAVKKQLRVILASLFGWYQ
jgi:hypothetical protein